MTQDEMYNVVFKRPKHYFQLSFKSQWYIDEQLGILDWDGNMNEEQKNKYNEYFNIKK